jgi:hypothetical protein
MALFVEQQHTKETHHNILGKSRSRNKVSV